MDIESNSFEEIIRQRANLVVGQSAIKKFLAKLEADTGQKPEVYILPKTNERLFRIKGKSYVFRCEAIVSRKGAIKFRDGFFYECNKSGKPTKKRIAATQAFCDAAQDGNFGFSGNLVET